MTTTKTTETKNEFATEHKTYEDTSLFPRRSNLTVKMISSYQHKETEQQQMGACLSPSQQPRHFVGFFRSSAILLLLVCNIALSSSVVVVVAFTPSLILRHHRDIGHSTVHTQNHPRDQAGRQQLQDRWSFSATSAAVSVLDKPTTTTKRTTEGDVVRSVPQDNNKDRVYTVQILMSDTGGGHRASANAIRDALDVLYPGKFVCDIVDLYSEYGPFWPYNDYPRMYKIMAKYSWMWDLFYKFGETDFGLALNEFLLTTFCTPSFKQCLQRTVDPETMVSPKKRADMVVSVHPLCQDVPLKILEKLDGGKRTTPFVTVVTDLGGAHKTWFNPSVDKCFVPSDVLNQKARSRGLQSSQIVQHGLPVRRGFWVDKDSVDESTQKQIDLRSKLPFFATERSDLRTTAKSETIENTLREKLGLQSELPTCLVVGGGDGMGGIVEIASALGKELGSRSSEPTSQMVVVCGKNQQAQASLDKIKWGDGVNVCVKGFVSNMDEWMKAADCLVTKAGPGTIAEACICGLPCMLFAYLPGQEEGNVPFVEDNGFGQYSSDPEVIAQTVSSWLESPEKIESMKTAALDSSRPNSTLDIAKDLAEIVFTTTAA